MNVRTSWYALIPGNESTGPDFPIVEAQLLLHKRLPTDQVVALPVSDWVTPNLTDHGTHREYRSDLPFNAAVVNPGPEVEGLSVIGRNPEWHALRTGTSPLSVVLDF